MGFTCAICRTTPAPGVAVHHFPNPYKYWERFQEWVYKAGGNLNSQSDIDYYHKKKRICDIHFTVKHKNRNKRVSAIAVPTLHLPGPPFNPGKENTKLQETAPDQSDPDNQENYILIVDQHGSSDIQEKCQPIEEHTQIVEATGLSDSNCLAGSSPDVQEKCQPVRQTQLAETTRLYIREQPEQANDGFLALETDPLADDVEDCQDVTPAPKISKVNEVKVANLVKLTVADYDVKDQDVAPAPKISKVNEVKVANLVKLTVADDDVKDQDVAPAPNIFKVNKVKKVDNLVKLRVADVKDQNVASAPKIFQLNKVNVGNLVKLPESLCAKPTPRTEEENAELYLLDILDPDLLTDSIEPEKQDSLGKNLRSTLSRAWPPILAGGLASETKQKIIGRYPRPKNCRLLQTPKMYPKMAEIVPEKVIANDDKWFKMQLCVGTAITAISRAMEMLLVGKSREKALRHLTNSCLILCDLHYTHTMIRTTSVIPFVDDTTKAVINDYGDHDDTLFGPDFIKKWKAAKQMEQKRVKKKVPKRVKKKKVTCRSGPSVVAYSGRWRAPLPQTPKRRYRLQRPGGNPVGGVMRNRTKQLKQTEQYDAFGNIITPTPPDIEASHSQMQTDTGDGCVQREVTDDVLKQTSVTYNRNNTVERTYCGDGTIYNLKNRTNEIEHSYALVNKITSTPPDIETSTSHMQTQMEDGYIQPQPVVDQLNQPRSTDNPKHPVKRKNPMICDANKPSRRGSTKKLKRTEQFDALGNRIRKLYRLDRVSSIPTSHPHMQIQRRNAPARQQNPQSLRYSHAHLSQPTINYYNPNKTVIITRGAIPLVLPPQMPSRDMPTLNSDDMPVLHSNNEPPDLTENTQTDSAQVHHGIVDTVTEVNTESGVALLFGFRHE